LQVGQVMIELAGQRRQRPAARSAEHDLAHQVTGQLLRQHGAWHSQHICRRLLGASQAGIIQGSQLSGYPCLQPFQQRHRPGQPGVWHGLTEDFADHHGELPDLLTAGWAHLIGGGLDRGGGRLPQRPLLITAQHPARSAFCGWHRRAAQPATPQDRQQQTPRQQSPRLRASLPAAYVGTVAVIFFTAVSACH
jgi:hypothetical protein